MKIGCQERRCASSKSAGHCLALLKPRGWWIAGLLVFGLGVTPSLASANDDQVWEFDAPGRIRDELALRDGDQPALFLLVDQATEESEDEIPIQLLRVDLQSGKLTSVLEGISSESRPRLDRLRGGSGEPARVALIQEGLLRSFAASGVATSEREELKFEPGVQVVMHADRPLVALADIGEVTVHDLGGSRQPFRQDTPVEVDPLRSALDLSSPPVRPVAGDAVDRTAAFVVGPQVLGNLRLRTQLVQPWIEAPAEEDMPEGEESGPPSAWAMLPGLEKVERSFFWELDGRSVLGVVTLRADKQGILERKKLRLFELKEDRTRKGVPPFFEVLTASRMWQQLRAELADFDGDGVLDLALLQPEGLGGEKLLVDVYRGSSSSPGTVLSRSRFAPKAARRVIKTAESWMTIEYDWTGDGLPDLLVKSGSQLRAFDLRTTRKGKTVLQAPSWSIDFPEATHPGEVEEGQQPVRRVRETDGILVLTAQFRPDGQPDGPVHVVVHDRR